MSGQRGNPVPDGIKAPVGTTAGGERQQPAGPGEGRVINARPVKGHYSIGWLKGVVRTVAGQVSPHRIIVPAGVVQASHRHHRPLAPFGLVNGGDQRLRARIPVAGISARAGGHVAHRNAYVIQGVQIRTGHPVLHAVE